MGEGCHAYAWHFPAVVVASQTKVRGRRFWLRHVFLRSKLNIFFIEDRSYRDFGTASSLLAVALQEKEVL